jgi:LemA protein
MASMITSCEEPRDEVIRGLQLRYSTNTILESAIFIAEHIYGNSLYRLTTIIEVCEVDYHLLRAMHKGGAKERASLLARLSRLSHIGSMVGFAEEGLRDTEREVQLYATATLIASHPERAIGYIAKLKAPLSLYEVAILTQLMRRAGTPIAYTPLLLSDNRNLQYTGIYICAQLAIVDAEEHLQAARRVYNANVTAYNTAIAMFPASLLAGGRTPKAFFEAEAHKRADVKMEF